MFEKLKDECDLKVGEKGENDTKWEREGPSYVDFKFYLTSTGSH